MIRRVLDVAKAALKQQTGLDVLLDPQPLSGAEPHIRLTFTGSRDLGDDRDELDFQLSIVGAGDGPDVYLPKVINASLRVSDLYRQGTFDVRMDESHWIRISFPETLTNSGQFVRQGDDETENSTWAYVYTEPHVITIDFNRSLRG